VHRNSLLSLLEKYSVRYPEEELMISRYKNFVTDNENCFDRELLSGHVTGSAWVLDQHFSKTLLTHHKKLNNWFQPGGHADGDGDVAAVAMREAEEETGLKDLEFVSDEIYDLDIHLIPARKSEPEHYHYDCRFLICCAGDETYSISKESNDLAWVPLNEIDQYTDEASIRRMVQKSSIALTGDMLD
jgi:8-oxo-dGTP pyrophosphatase MutT (NUDIX family)